MSKASRFDVVIVGAGPAGSMCAILLARRGYKTLLLDRAKFPRYKVCGSCLSPAALQLLETCGLANHVIPDDAPFLTKMRLYCGERCATVSLPPGRAVSRASLDSNMLSAAAVAGASIMTQTRFAKIIDQAAGSVRFEVLNTSNEQTTERISLESSLLIDASGLASAVMKHFTTSSRNRSKRDLIGIGASVEASELESGVVEMHLTDAGYVGAVSVDGGILDLAAACQPSHRKLIELHIKAIAERYTHAHTFDIRGTPILESSAPLNIGMCVALGDSACYLEPFTGQGISWALSSAYQFCGLVIKHGLNQAAVRWPLCFQTTIRPQMRVCRVFGALRRAQLLGPRSISLINAFPTLSNFISKCAWREVELHS